jgi:lysophospholipase L1-like esterase
MAARLQNGSGSLTVALLGDSTGNDSNEWWRLFLADLSAEYPRLRVESSRWAGSTQKYVVDATLPASAPSPTLLTAFNGSVSGTTFDYQAARLPAMLPVVPDVVFLSSSHNYSTVDAASYASTVRTLVAAVRSLHPATAIVAVSQNPQTAPREQWRIDAQLSRQTELRIEAARNGWDYLPVLETFLAEPEQGRTYVQDDGLHPTVSGETNGSRLWADVATEFVLQHVLP